MKLRILLLTFLFSAFTANVFTQDQEPEAIQNSGRDASAKYDELINELDFDRTKNVWKLKKPEKKEEELLQEEDDAFNAVQREEINFNGGFANVLAYIMIIGLIILIIYLVFSNVKVDKKIDVEEVNMMDIENIEEVDTLIGFKKAVTISDYRSAIRMQFIKVLQMLQDGNHIHWRPEKTNRDYLRELNGTKFKTGFRELSSIYELVWYGNTSIDKNDFERLNPYFDQFINRGDEQ